MRYLSYTEKRHSPGLSAPCASTPPSPPGSFCWGRAAPQKLWPPGEITPSTQLLRESGQTLTPLGKELLFQVDCVLCGMAILVSCLPTCSPLQARVLGSEPLVGKDGAALSGRGSQEFSLGLVGFTLDV